MVEDFRDEKTENQEKNPLNFADRRDGMVYCYTDKIILAVNVALVTGRPLLVRGKSGCGKSTLAYNIARVLKRRYYEYVVTSRSQATDLQWRFDAVRRLGDAQAKNNNDASQPIWKKYYPYIEPGVLWWVFNYKSAKHRGTVNIESEPELLALSNDFSNLSNLGTVNIESKPELLVDDPAVFKPCEDESTLAKTSCVILIDEIDKADPDFANNLLVPLGSLQFRVDGLPQPIISFQTPSQTELSITDLPLVVITTNEERRLPQAFLRRCIILKIEDPSEDYLIEIAKIVEGNKHEKIYRNIIEAMNNLFEQDQNSKNRRRISTAEFLDTVRAYMKLATSQVSQEELNDIINLTTLKEMNDQKSLI